MTFTTIETITVEQIQALRNEAGAAGDCLMTSICDGALAGDASSIAECVHAINAAEAMLDDDDE